MVYPMDFATLQDRYAGRYVAILNDERVVASGRSFNDVALQISAMKVLDHRLVKIQFVNPKKVR
jgi:hypothetical protein